MSYDVELPNGDIIEVPDNVSQAEAKQRIYKAYPQFAPKPVSPSTERTFGEAITDPLLSLVKGTGSMAQLPGQLYGLATGDFDTAAMRGPAQLQEYAKSLQSKGLQAREALRDQAMSDAEKRGIAAEFYTAITQTLKDPALISTFITETIPEMIPMLVTGGASKLFTTGVSQVAKLGAKEAAENAAKVALRTGIATGAVQQGADVGSDTYVEALELARAQYPNKSQAEIQDIALNAARATAAEAGVVSLGAQFLPGAKAIERRLAGIPGEGRIRSGLGEAAGEMLEEGGGKFASNVNLQQIDPERSLTAGVGSAAGLGAIGGGAMGAVIGRRAPEPELMPGQNYGESLAQAANRLQAEIRENQKLIQPVERAITAVTQAPVDPVVAPFINPPQGSLFSEGNLNVGTANAAPGGEGTLLAGVPGTGGTAAGVAATQPDGVVPTGQDVAGVAGGEGTTSTSVEPVILQNRDRASPASIEQMQDISARPDYTRLGFSRDITFGAPVVFGGNIPTQQFGNVDVVAAGSQKIPVQYAVMDANDVVASNTVDGSAVPEYSTAVDKTRAVGGNGRIAGLQSAYQNRNAAAYNAELLTDTFHGISPDVIKGIKNPVLVRVMPASEVTKNIGDLTNTSGILRLSPTEQAKNDSKRVDLDSISYNADGDVTDQSVVQFIQAMPQSERGEMIDANGATRQARDRLHAAIFASAYQNDQLIRLYAQAVDPDAKNVLNALSQAAPQMARLNGAGALDFRNEVVAAAEQVVNAKRAGISTPDMIAQVQIGENPNVHNILTLFANNIRSAKRMAETLKEAANYAYHHANTEEQDMFGDVVPKPTKEDITQGIKEGKEYPKLSRAKRVPKEQIDLGLTGEEEQQKKAKAKFERVATAEAPERIAEKKEQFKNILGKILSNMGLKDVAVKLMDDIESEKAEGSYAEKLIKIALDADKPVRTLRHEAIHALKELGFFSDNQWKVLTKQANDVWIDKYLKNRGVGGGPLKEGEQSRYDAYMEGEEFKADPNAIIEEAIADAFGDFDATKSPPGMIQAILKRMNDFFAGLKRALSGAGFLTSDQAVEQLFGKIERGELKAGETKAGGEKLSLAVPKPLADRGITQEHIDLYKDMRAKRDLVDGYAAYPTPSDKAAATRASTKFFNKIAPLGEQKFTLNHIANFVDRQVLPKEKLSLRAPDTKEFKQFFGDSKVVDENGEPLVVYHGTGLDIKVFDKSKQDSRDAGFWFGSKEDAGNYGYRANGNIMPVYLNISNPKVYYNRDIKITPELIEKLKAQGFDGVKRDFAKGPDAWRYGEDATPEWSAFEPTQIKSATGNIGTYNRENPDIRYSLRNSHAAAKKVARQLNLTEEEINSTVLKLRTGLGGDKAFNTETIGKLPAVVDYLQSQRLLSGLPPLDVANEDDRTQISRLMAAEALAAIDVSGKSLEWYDQTISKTLGMMALRFPELKRNVNARMVFRLGMAITSQNLNVVENLKFAIKQYESYRNSKVNGVGKFPEMGSGKNGNAMISNFIMANAMIKEYGENTTRRFLETSFTVKELRAAGFNISGELGTENILGSSIFGPKIGFGFYSNLSGNFDPVTMDMWFMRTIGRLTGKLRLFNQNKFDAQLDKFRNSFEERGEEGIFADEFSDDLVESAKTNVDDAVKLARVVMSVHEGDYKNLREFYTEKIRKKSTLVLTADRLLQSIDKPRDVPANGTERRQLRDVVAKTLAIVKEKTGKDIPAASMQALIWYPEQELYKSLGVRLKVTSTDYAKALNSLLTEGGYSGTELSAAGKSGSRFVQRLVRRNEQTGDSETGQKPERPNALTGEERTKLLTDRKKPKLSLRDKLGLYSELENKIEAVGPNQAPAPQWKAMIKGMVQKGVKPEEIEWSGVNDYLDLQEGKVPKAALLEYLKEGGVKVEETTLQETAPPELMWKLVKNDDFKEYYETTFINYRDEIEKISIALKPNGKWWIYGGNDDAITTALSKNDAENYAVAYAEENKNKQRNGPKYNYGQLILPGGTNYREVLLTLPSIATPERQLKINAIKKTAGIKYRSSHWNQPNVLAHIRINDRVDVGGKKVLFVEEVQSDWGQEGKRKGFISDLTPITPTEWETVDRHEIYNTREEAEKDIATYPPAGDGINYYSPGEVEYRHHIRLLPGDKQNRYEIVEQVRTLATKTGRFPKAPFVTKTEGWLNLALKRIMVLAAEGNYDKVAFINGKQSAKRYNLAAYIDTIDYEKDDQGTYEFVATDKEGKTVYEKEEMSLFEIEELVGKDIAKKIEAGEGEKSNNASSYRDWHTLSNVDLEVGEGKGMKVFYDQIVPIALKKLLPKVGGKELITVDIKETLQQRRVGQTLRNVLHQPGFDVTPEMKQKVETTGLPKFSLRRAYSPQWTNERIDSLLRQYAYTQDGREGDTQAYAALIKPRDFLDATSTKEYRKVLETERTPLDVDKLKNEVQPIYLEVKQIEEGVFEVKGHEGRHRMMALRDAGVEDSVPVVLLLRPYNVGVKDASIVEEPYFKPQVFGKEKAPKGFYSSDAIPISYKHKKDLQENFGRESDIKFSLRNTFSGQINAAVDRTTTFREETKWGDKLLGWLSPTSKSEFRAAMINRYNELGIYDRRRAEKMGGFGLLADASAESAALFSDLGSSLTAAIMGPDGGAPVYANGITTVSNFGGTVKGPLEIFAELERLGKGDIEIYRYYQVWAGVKRAERLMPSHANPQGTEINFKQSDIPLAKEIEKRFPEFVAIQKEWIKYNDKLAQYLVDTGVIGKEAKKEWVKYGDYVPFYRQVNDIETVGPKLLQAIAGVKGPKKIKGDSTAPLADFLETVIRNTQAAVQMGVKNVAAQRAVLVAMDLNAPGKTDVIEPLNFVSSKPDTVTILVDGQQRSFRSNDTLWLSAITSLNLPDVPFVGVFTGPANLLRALVTKDPGFMLANMMRDSMQAMIASDYKTVNPATTLMNFAATLAGSSPEFKALMNAGVVGGNDYTKDIVHSGKAFAKDLRKAAGQMTTAETLLSPVTGLWDALERGTTASDAATREQIYKEVLKRTTSPAYPNGNMAEAIYRAMEVMNFNRKGNSAIIRFLTGAIPFFNARIQGLDVLYRAGFGIGPDKKSAAAIQKQFFIRGATMFAMSCMYWTMTHDDDDYKNQEQETKDNYWLLPSLGVKIPIPFEVGILFKVIPERIMAAYFGTDTADDFTRSMKRQLINTLDVNWLMPQTVKPFLETVTNHSFFTDRPIIGQGMETIEEGYQAGANTSKIAADIGKAVGYSPMKIDHLVSGYTGTMGMYAFNLLDAIYKMNDDKTYASKRFEQTPVLKRFLVDPNARGTVTAYYETKNAADSAVRTAALMERTMNYAEWGPYYKENIKVIATHEYLLDLEKTMKELREMRMQIVANKADPDEKRDALANLNRVEAKLTANIQIVKKNMK